MFSVCNEFKYTKIFIDKANYLHRLQKYNKEINQLNLTLHTIFFF